MTPGRTHDLDTALDGTLPLPSATEAQRRMSVDVARRARRRAAPTGAGADGTIAGPETIPPVSAPRRGAASRAVPGDLAVVPAGPVETAGGDAFAAATVAADVPAPSSAPPPPPAPTLIPSASFRSASSFAPAPAPAPSMPVAPPA